ncbi:MAG: O-methyltransferase [Gemmatimonadaceae bacterium]|jgi:predicted O-methyltransferase YrrM|nr:O-methyltransferase [Gemmatimonadaceae bacterium]
MSTPTTWNAVDDFLVAHLLPTDPALDAALADSAAAGLPAIAVSPTQGKLLHLMARLRGARTILEIGTLGGYSTIWLARALPADGSLVTLELDPHHAAIARRNLDRAGVGARVTIEVGAALDTLPTLVARPERFDFIFIDADKANVPAYYEWSLKLATAGAAIIVDNAIRRGDVTATASVDPHTLGLRALFAALAADARVDATAIQTVGHKGYDGFLLAVVR